MTVRDALHEVCRNGELPKPALVVMSITTLAELDAYRVGLSEKGKLDSDAMAAIRDRQDVLHKRGAA